MMMPRIVGSSVTLTCAVMAGAGPAQEGGVTMAWGIQANGLGESETLVRYDPLSPTTISTRGPLVGLGATQFVNGLAFTPDGQLWATAADTASSVDLLLRLSPATGAVVNATTITGLTAALSVTDLAYNPVTGTMYTLAVSGQQPRSFVYELDLVTGAATPVAEPTPTPAFQLGMAITSDGHFYFEDVATDTIYHYDDSFVLQGTIPLGFDAGFNQGMGADWSGDDTLYLGGWDAAAPSGDQGVSYTFLGDLTGYTFHGIIGGAGSANEIADVTFLPTQANDLCEDALPLLVPSIIAGTTDGASSNDLCFGLPTPAVWYSVTGNGSIMTASLCGFADFDTLLSVCCGSCGDPTFVALDDDGCAPTARSIVIWCAEEGAEYLIGVQGFDNLDFGDFVLEISEHFEPCTPTVDCPTCPWDCAEPLDGQVGIEEFLAILGTWGSDGPCDYDGGGVGIEDFLKVLGVWGTCP